MRRMDSLFTKHPTLEVKTRLIYAKVKEWDFVKKLSKKALGRSVSDKSVSAPTCSREDLFQHIRSLGLQKGDILIVHSSMDHLSLMGVNAKEVIDFFLEVVGEEGTLAVPAFPQFSEYEDVNGVQAEVYDVRRTVAWTGMIPNFFLRYKGVVRSEWPCNPLAAKGAEAEQMMRDNLKAPYSQGKGTAWGYCAEHHAKVLFLGVKPFHSISESHIAEDYLADEWPIANWYIDQLYVIKKGKERNIVTLKKRDPKWATYLSEYYNADRMKKEGILREENYKGLDLGFIEDLHVFNEKRIEDIRAGILDYRIPQKYWKKIIVGGSDGRQDC